NPRIYIWAEIANSPVYADDFSVVSSEHIEDVTFANGEVTVQFAEDFEEDSYEEESYEEEFYEEDSYVQDFVSALYDDQIEVEDVYIDGVDDLIDTLPTHREELLDTSEEEPAQTVEEDVEEDLEEDIDENFDAEFEEAAQEDLDAVFDDTLIDELEEAQMDDFAIEEERLAREQERLEAEIAEQERLIAESRASRAQLDEIAAELDRSIARENLAAQRAAREQVEREKFERTQQMPVVDVQQQDYQYTEVGEPLAHRTQGKRIARHRNKRWFR
ncbi:MAG: hypothetical protein J6L88_05425, partial [Clostridia bacterium]|nr:hypothetical protein [Clostridia bacterium]